MKNQGKYQSIASFDEKAKCKLKIKIKINIAKYYLSKGCYFYMVLPSELKNAKGLINLKTKDDASDIISDVMVGI